MMEVATNPEYETSVKLLEKYWEVFKQKKLPLPKKHLGTMQKYGCAGYGCVFPTYTKNVVVKVTGDPTEAGFAVLSMHLREKEGLELKGLVQYHHAAIMPEQVSKYDSINRPEDVYVLWREEAYDLNEVFSREGRLAEHYNFDHSQASDAHSMTTNYLMSFLVEAEKPYLAMKAIRRNESREAAIEYGRGEFENFKLVPDDDSTLSRCNKIAERMGEIKYLRPIGDTFVELASVGILIGDAHPGNIGMVDRVPSGPVVTDPGHVAVLNPDLMVIGVPSL
jgi:hypothetical protein